MHLTTETKPNCYEFDPGNEFWGHAILGLIESDLAEEINSYYGESISERLSNFRKSNPTFPLRISPEKSCTDIQQLREYFKVTDNVVTVDQMELFGLLVSDVSQLAYEDKELLEFHLSLYGREFIASFPANILQKTGILEMLPQLADMYNHVKQGEYGAHPGFMEICENLVTMCEKAIRINAVAVSIFSAGRLPQEVIMAVTEWEEILNQDTKVTEQILNTWNALTSQTTT
ncbi:MAG TPA: hypothetical protein VD999_07490 [Vitreimonas sp.]|nr:hypothetical protein [Vitreimonas sp.]